MNFRSITLLIALITSISIPLNAQNLNIDTIQAKKWLEEGKILFEDNQVNKAGEKFYLAANVYKELKQWEQYKYALGEIINVQRKLYSFQPATDVYTVEENDIDKLEKDNPILLARIFHLLAKSKNHLREYEACISDVNKALILKRKHDPSDTTMIADMLLVNSFASYYLGDIENAAKMASKSIKIEEQYSKALPLNISNGYNNLSGMYAGLYEFDKALEAAHKSLEIRTDNLPKNHKSLGDCYNNLSAIYNMTGDYESALIYMQELISLNTILYNKTHITYINTYKNKSALLYSMGLYQRSIEVLDYIVSEQDMKTFVDHIEYPNILHSYGLNLKGLGKDKEALDTLKKAFKLASQIPNFLELSEMESTLGQAYLNMNMNEEAIDSYRNSIRRQQNLMPNSPRIGNYYGNIGLVYKKNGQFEEAEKNILIGLQNTTKILPEGHPEILDKRTSYIDLLNLKKEYKKAFEYQVNIKEIQAASIPDILTYYSTKINSGANILTKNNKSSIVDSCHTWIKKGINQIQLSKLLYLPQGERFVYQKSIYKFCEEALNFIYKYGNDIDKVKLAFEITEESKGFILLQNLKLKNNFYPVGVPKYIVDEEIKQRNRITSLQLKISQSFDDPKILAEARLALLNCREDYSKIIDNINKEYPKYGKMKFGPANSSLNEITQLLDEEQAIISYFDGGNHIYSLSITRQKVILERSIKDDNWKDAIEFQNRINSEINNYVTDEETKFLFDSTLYASVHIYNSVLKNTIEGLPSTVKSIIIIPDGDLNFVSFESLLENNENENTYDYRKLNYLLNRFNISYAPSSTIWVESKKIKNKTDKDYIGFGPSYNNKTSIYNKNNFISNQATLVAMRDGLADLPAARESVLKSSLLFDGDAYLEEQASKNNFLGNIGSSAILHLAMHGIVDHKNPMLSKLVFTKNDQDSTAHWLNASEIYHLDLSNQLSVLSACNTGVGKLRRGEGVMSLSRAFGYAGSPSLMMSLWSIPDVQTSEITSTFFQNLKNGEAKNSALRMAKLAYLKNTPKSSAHPMYWAGFTISGNMDPIVFQSSGMNLKYILGFSLLCSLFLFFMYKRKSGDKV